MLKISAGHRRSLHGVSRREVLRVGAANLLGLGLTLPGLLKAEAAPAAGRSRIKSVVLMFLEGGPAHQDTWDMKPDAPDGVRSAFKPIETTVPGLSFCEHLPMLARQAHHLMLVRSVHHTVVDHNAGTYYALTGREPFKDGRLIVAPAPDNFPPFGSVLAKFSPSGRPLPDNVLTPDWMSNNGFILPGLDAGFLGTSYDPFVTGDPSLPKYQVPGLGLPKELSLNRVERRRELLDDLDQLLGDDRGTDGLDSHYQKAYELISSPEARRAFDVAREPQDVRERYGLYPNHARNKEARQFGGLPQLGQSLLLTRRLVEAGVRLVTVCTGPRFDQTWDTHRQHYGLLKQSILPYFDRAFSAFLEDLHERRLLDSTLVVAMGEFGRTPKIGQITSSAGADAQGRDHWPFCYTALFAGGGLPGGTVLGSSDRDAAYPASMPVTPADIAATIYKLLGIDPEMPIYDGLQRPHALSVGTPIPAIVG
jgi:hypothetical protein